MRKVIGWIKNNWVLAILVVALLFNSGVSIAAAGEGSDWGAALPITVVIAVVAQVLTIGVWVGVTKTTIKQLKQSISSIGDKRDEDAKSINDIENRVISLETQQENNSKYLGILQKIQSKCKWIKEEPKDFVRKDV